MSVAQFESISMIVLITALIGFMTFIILDLAKKSGAGKFGTLILFTALGVGVLGFVIKTILTEVIKV